MTDQEALQLKPGEKVYPDKSRPYWQSTYMRTILTQYGDEFEFVSMNNLHGYGALYLDVVEVLSRARFNFPASDMLVSAGASINAYYQRLQASMQQAFAGALQPTSIKFDTTFLLPKEDPVGVLRAQRKRDGVCPDCGDRGQWRMLALFCPEHGRFAG